MVFREINVNRGDVDDDETLDTVRKNAKPTIYQTMFEDKGLSNSKSELILDLIYLSFFQTFKGLYAMLEKKHYKDES